MPPLIFNVQRFSLHDGPGIRSTVFFKGCPLRCRWCHNPESWAFEAEEVFRPERCVQCGQCAQGCASGARALCGRAYDVEALTGLLLRDRQMYETSGGGVTLSGGEALCQDTEYLASLLTALKRRGIHTAIDTCGHAQWDRIEPLLTLADLWLYDLKALDPGIHVAYTDVDNRLILRNLDRLTQAGAKLWLRVPIVPGVNDSDDEMRAMIDFARAHSAPQRVCLLPYHRLGQHKSDQPADFDEPAPEHMAALRAMWQTAFADVRIGG